MDHRDRDEEFERVAEAQRTTKAEARRQATGTQERGIELPARSYTDETGVADLGVDEPVLPAQPDGETDGSRPGADPTGMFAGETVEDRQEEARVRRVLQDGRPGTRDRWKTEGRLPNVEQPTCATCGGTSRDDDAVCPHCGASPVAG